MDKIRMIDVILLLGLPLPPNGRSAYNIPCPFCDSPQHGKHLNINLKKEVFCCPKCGEGGGIFDMYSLFSNTPRKKAKKNILNAINMNTSPVIKREPTPTPPTEVESPLADINIRHDTYSVLLSMLSLSGDHVDNLKNRGLNDSDITALGYKTTPVIGMQAIASQLISQGYTLAGVPGFYSDKNDNWMLVTEQRGILIPVKDSEGRIQGLQIRRDNAEKRKFRWLSSIERKNGCGSNSWVHIAGPVRSTMLLTEGAMKGDVIHSLSGASVISVQGVNALKHLAPVLQELKNEGLTTIKTAFDMDMLCNYHVQKGYNSLLYLLDKLEFKFSTYLWNPYYKGLDDYLYHLSKENSNP